MATQNVRGFSKKRRRTAAWFDGLRARIDGDRTDVVFLQETKATRNWAETLEQNYARGWGLRAEQVETPLSWWTSTKRASGGVAILFHPDSSLRQLTPCWPELWGPHCLALHGQVDGCELTLVCIYAPVDRTAREALFSALSRLRPTGTVILGGDFNCSLDASLDRSHPTGDAHDSPRLAHLLHRWSMVDSAISDMLEAAATGSETDFHARAHSYWYRLPDGQRASSRLDRWYITDADYNLVHSTTVTPPCSHSDHDAVLLRVGPPAQSTRVKSQSRRSIRYPPPRYAQEVVAAESSAFLAKVSALKALDPQVSAMQWDVLKDEFRVQLLRAVRVSARKLRGSYRQRLRRLRAALRAERARDTHPRARGSLVQRFELLTVDSTARQESLRAAIVTTQELYAANRRIRKFEQYTGNHSDATRALFRRISMKYEGRKSSRARAPTGHVDAKTLARDWQPILQQDSPTQLDRETFFARLAPPNPRTLQLDCTAFSASEVAKAIASCPRGKACGPDGLPNDWYRDFDEALAPILAALLSGWMRARVLPPSFASATVCCIPKTSTPRSGLDYRPIALLNSDYKIYSRLLLNRVKDSLASVLAPTQFGFVPGRQVHDAIDVWSAVQRLVHERRLPDTTTAVLLDFAKAYDTLDRTFLSLALAHHGFPRDLIDAIEDMHLATTARFLSRGELSDDVAIHNGIRQGCPLAPVLFVLAIDLLYQAAERDSALAGVRLDDRTRVKLGGYADDTTAFLAEPAEEPALLCLLEDFGAASGLRANVSKCAVVCCSRDGPTAAHATMALPVMSAEQHCRLLGFQIAGAPAPSHIWALTLQQLRTTLHLAELKTTDTLQRARICEAVVLPKLTFIGRHAWPTADTIDMLQRFVHNFVWSGSVAASPKTRRAWLRAEIATLPPAEGGIGVPDVRQAFLRLSGRVVHRWASADSPLTAAVGRILLRQAPSSQSHRSTGLVRLPTVAARLDATIASTGLAQIRNDLTLPRLPDEVEAADLLLPSAGRRGPRSYHWEDGWLHCRYDTCHAPLAELRRLQTARYGAFSVACLLAADAAGAGIIRSPDGHDLHRRDCPDLLASGDTIGDIVEPQWCGAYHVRFHCRKEPYPLRPRTALQFRRFCDLLVFNYPALLSPHNPPQFLQPRPASEARWYVTKTDGRLRLWLENGSGIDRDLGTVSSTRTAARAARMAGHAVASFDPHPWLEPFARLWNLSPPRAQLAVPARPVNSALQLVESRVDQACADDAAIGAALRRLSWRRLARLPASVSTQRLLLMKIKALRLSGWVRSLDARGCPHCAGIGPTGGHTFHIMWYCPAAAVVWNILLRFWQRLGSWRDATVRSPSFLEAVFSVRLPATPVGAAPFASAPGCPNDPDVLHALVQHVWTRQVLAGFQVIWLWRQGVADDENPWTQAVARSAYQGRLIDALQASAYTLDADTPGAGLLRHFLRLCQRFVPFTAALPPTPSSTDVFVLFFDGGSRGNPGPGGAGSIVVRTDRAHRSPRIVWSAATSLAAPTTTNNQAEYIGLITGLKAAARAAWHPLEVVGDSLLILRQVEGYRSPKNPRLRDLYLQARGLADQLGVARWHHHLRAYNKMADAAANIAMDGRRSILSLHPTPRPEWAGIELLLQGDFLQWRAAPPR